MRARITIYKMMGMSIGEGSRISHGFYVDRPEGVIIGNNCFLNHFVHLHNGSNPSAVIIIGDNVFIGPEVKFFCASHEIGPQGQRAGKNTYGSITVENGVWIGANATIFPDVVIARGGVIGASATVTKSTEENSLYYGVPATKIRKL